MIILLLTDNDDAVEPWATDKSDASSSKSLAFVVNSSGKSMIYTKKDKGSKIKPWGTPALLSKQFEH